MKPNSSHISLRTWSTRKGHTHVKNGLLHEYLARRCTGVECVAQEAQSTTVCNNSRDGTSSWTEAPAPFYEQPSHRFTDMGCEQKMMANGKNSLLRADARVRLNNLMKPNNSHISLRTWSAKEGNTHVKNGLLHEYLARRCTGVECFAQEAQYTTVCNNSRDGTSSCTEAPAAFSYEQPSHRFTDMERKKGTYTRKEWPPSRVSRTSLYGRGVLCSRSTIYDCMQQLKGWNIFLDRGAPTSSYEQPSHRFTDMG